MMFRDRIDAGRQLARKLEKFKGQPVVVLGLPRGGVPVAAEVATALQAPFGLAIARKIGHPANPEYAIGAVTEFGPPVLNPVESGDVDPVWLEEEVTRQRAEAKRRHELYLGKAEALSASGKIAIVVDDGIATGLTMKAAIQAVKAQDPIKVVVAVPVSPKSSAEEIAADVDEFVAVSIPEPFWGAIGAYYDDFSQVSDDEVVAIMGSGCAK